MALKLVIAMRIVSILILVLFCQGLKAQFFPVSGGGGGSDLWQTTNGFYEPKEVKPFSFDYQGFLLKNDSVNVGLNIPYVGSIGKDYGSYKSFSGIVDANVVGVGDLVTMGWINFGGGQFNAITIYDTTYIQLMHKNVEVKINDNGLVLPLLSADPTGEDGSMYFNTSMNKIRIYHGGTWHNNN